MNTKHHQFALLLACSTVLIVGCSMESQLGYKSDIQPLMDKYCSECHKQDGEGALASGFVTDSYDSTMQGTKYGPVVVPGDPLSSSLYRLVSGKVHSSIRMPHGKDALADEEIVKIEQWIQQGAKY